MKKQKQKKKQILMNKPVYLGHLMLDVSKTLTYKFWYDNVKQRYFYVIWIQIVSMYT